MRRFHEHGRGGGFLPEKRVAEQRSGFGRVASGGLLEEDVLPGLDGAEGPFVVEGCGSGDVDARDGSVIEDLFGESSSVLLFLFRGNRVRARGHEGFVTCTLITCFYAGDSVPVCVFFGLVGIARRNGVHLHVGVRFCW